MTLLQAVAKRFPCGCLGNLWLNQFNVFLASGAGSSKNFLAVATACNKVIYKYIHVQRVGEFTVDMQQHDRVQPLGRH